MRNSQDVSSVSSIPNLASNSNWRLHHWFTEDIEACASRGASKRSYPVADVHVDILDGDAHEKDSNDQAFQLAAASAVREALQKAKPVLLEPVMRVEVDAPSGDQGDLLGDDGGVLEVREDATLALEGFLNNGVLEKSELEDFDGDDLARIFDVAGLENVRDTALLDLWRKVIAVSD